MEILCRAVFMPLAVVLLVLAFHDGARERVLNLRGIARLERRLTLSNKGYWVAFGLLLAVGAFVRCYRFLELPMGQNQDGTMAAVEALCLADNGTDQYGTSWPTYFEAWGYSQMSTLYSYLLIPFVKLFGLSKFTLRFPMLLMGLLTLPLMWDVARRIGGRGFALTALFLLALNPWHMVMSRWALEANMLPHVVLLAAELLLIGTRRRWALYLSMVVFGLAPYAYGLAAVSVPCILLPMAIFLTARKKVKPLDLAVCVAIFAAVSGPYYATMVINAFGLETMTLGRMTMPRFEKSQRVNDISLGSPNPYLSMAQKLRDFLPTATGYYPAEGYSGIAWADTMYPFVIPAALYGWYRLCRDRRRLALRGSEERWNVDSGLDVRRHHQHNDGRRGGQPQQHSLLSVDSLRGVCALADGQAAAHGAGRDGRDDRNRFCRRVRRVFYRRGLSDGDGQYVPLRRAGSVARSMGLGLRPILFDHNVAQRRRKGHDGAGDVCAPD